MRSLLFSFIFLLSIAAPVTAQEKIDFARDVLPILSDNCFRCHGPDEKARKGDLRLDRKEDALRSTSPVIVPGKAATSEVIKRVISGDPEEMMPPPRANKKLTAKQIEILQKWVEQGAAWGQHWSFVKPSRPTVPRIRNSSVELRNPIDNFIVDRLNREGLKLSLIADKERLIRRVTLDLTGLPPT